MWDQVGSRLLANAVECVPRLAVALVVVGVGSLLARYVARTVLIGAVNLQIHSARLLSLAARWLVLVLAVAMGLDHLRIAADIVRLAFAILFGGMVLTIALAVGLGSKEMVSRSWKAHEKPDDQDPLGHV
jgi:hypothetical protein